MNRRFRNAGSGGRMSSGMGDYDSYAGYSGYSSLSQAGLLDTELSLRDDYLRSPGGGYRAGGGAYDLGFDRDREIMESLLQQQALQQQLSLRESQLALANTLLQQKNQPAFFNKRQMDFREPVGDFKRPRMMDNRPKPRNRSAGSQDSFQGGRGRGRGGGRGGPDNRRSGQTTPRGRGGQSPAVMPSPRPNYRTEGQGKQATQNRQQQQQKGQKKGGQQLQQDQQNYHGFCTSCDIQLKVPFNQHVATNVHKQRKLQITKGCGWCDVKSFTNFSAVLAHRATAKHKKNQKLHVGEKKGENAQKNAPEGETKPAKPKNRMRVELPPELLKYDANVITGQDRVIAVTGWFCKMCNKFYNNETTAKETHCKTEAHFNNYRKFFIATCRQKAEEEAKAKEEAEAREKAAAEEEGQKAEEPAAAAEEEMEVEDENVALEEEGGEEEEGQGGGSSVEGLSEGVQGLSWAGEEEEEVNEEVGEDANGTQEEEEEVKVTTPARSQRARRGRKAAE